MAINTRLLTGWEKILLDTTVIINLFLAKKGSNDPICLFIQKLMSYLVNNNTASGKERQFYISTITLSELLSDETERELIMQVLSVVNSKNVELIAFDDKIGVEIANSLSHHLSRTELHRFAQEIGWKTHELMMAREWINRDYMIAMSGKNRNIDLALTADHKTFYPICRNIDLECAVCEEEFFNVGGINIYEYHDYKAVSKYISIPAIIS
ncbi:type II toxin-antitoxin system VapC family toxin [Panacibacter ginsenosidivorans]|uniref:Type II toxin-antitoxin system VapC family toxin n=1 Tax=Panacibacter ginsenosidivorans TaxID=1813871 RepID=A0A5B8VAU9_9BACT|nr:type II toxin-antitoxin system VapC family toxin [Panacibacter ginsenosidivorans]QEC68574.1 type II toxin-antitoxin system VapC family toxin [Panacibacter ginsenosidivorans]